jgi:AraC family transcriptional activator of pobA
MGAKAYLDHTRMTEACRLLAYTRLPVAGIAFRLGYDDPSHFSKRFRAVCGMAPSAYRRAHPA